MKIAREVDAAPAAVWQVMTDLDRTAQVISGIIALERLDDGDDFGIGTRWTETRKMFGKEATETMEVTAIDDGRSYTVEAASHGAHYTSVMSVEPVGEGSSISWTFAAEATSTGAKIMGIFGKLFEGSTRKALSRDLDDIAAAAEKSAE